jgi:hypothetical protein
MVLEPIGCKYRVSILEVQPQEAYSIKISHSICLKTFCTMSTTLLQQIPLMTAVIPA